MINSQWPDSFGLIQGTSEKTRNLKFRILMQNMHFPETDFSNLKLAFYMFQCMFYFFRGHAARVRMGAGHEEGIKGVDLGCSGVG